MTQTNSHNPFDVADWATLQRRYLETLKTMGHPAGAAGASGLNPWQDALDFWWQRASATLPGEQRGLFEQIVRQARGYLACADFFAPLIEGLARATGGSADRERELRRQFDALSEKLAAGAVAPGMESLLGTWRIPENFWEQAGRLMARLPDEWTRLYGSTPMTGKVAGEMEALREGARLWEEYRQALADYLRLLAGAAQAALAGLQQRLLAGTKVDSLRALYDLWVDCGEDAYGELMSGDGFAAAFSRLVNSLSAFRLHARRMIDSGLELLDMPTDSALDSVQRRAAELRGELRNAEARQRQDRESLERLQQELEALRRMVQPGGDAPGN